MTVRERIDEARYHPMKTLEDVSNELIAERQSYAELKTKRKFTEGEIVRFVGKEPRKGYYKEADTEYDLCDGDLCVLWSFGGPRWAVVDRVVNDEVIRYSVDFDMIKKVKTK
jgi:hypothetical protein